MRAIYAYRPYPTHKHPAGIEARAPELLDTWLRRFPDSRPFPLPTEETEGSDPEDWIENATILHAAETLGVDLTLLPVGGRVHVSGSGWMVPASRPDAPVGAMFGHWTNDDFMKTVPLEMDVVGSDARSVRAASGYATSETFLHHAGRPMALANGDVEGERGIEAALRKVVDDSGSGDLFIKTVDKSWSGTFQVDPTLSEGLWWQIESADTRLMNETDCQQGYDLAFIPITHEGSRNDILLVQGRIAPTFEYRILVIDGNPVTASGCIEAFTPAENTAVFDPQMEEIRSDGAVVARPDLVERYLAFAVTFCAEFAAERGEGLDYSLDVCIDANTGAIVPIELNPPLNLGAYARNTEAWMKAVVDRTERVAASRTV